jgi:protein-L-isoaspartate(D-aspartate) O-methyltransferase
MDSEDLVAKLRREGIHDPRVLHAMAEVPRDRFVPSDLIRSAWEDRALQIGYGQTISQPFVVAFMLQTLELGGNEKVLDIGTGSGYQAALLSRLCSEVYTLEIIPELHAAAKRRLEELEAPNVHARLGDGWHGWPEAAPFNGILSACAAPKVPDPLVAQLAHGGRLVLPVGGSGGQILFAVHRSMDGECEIEQTLAVQFVPMTGTAQSPFA